MDVGPLTNIHARDHDTGTKPETCDIAVIASFALSLTNFRLELLRSMVLAGHRVTAYAPEYDDEVVSKLSEIGVRFVQVPMQRTGLNPVRDFATIRYLVREFSRTRPDVVLSYTMKPVIYTGIAARLAGVPRQYALITGLGYVFSPQAKPLVKSVIRRLSVWLYRIGLAKVDKLFVYNSADQDEMIHYRMVSDRQRMVPVNGSGVDLSHYTTSPAPTNPVTFLLIARLLQDKGVREFVKAAEEIRSRWNDVEFQILGPLDANPTSVDANEIADWQRQNIVTYLGETRDVRPHLTNCSVFVLPTYYREGIPRTILEALSTGRAIITTDMPGCDQTVKVGVNGYLVKPRSVESLVTAMEKFLEDPKSIAQMGAQSLDLAQQRFDVRKVNQKLLAEMDLI